MTNYTIEVQAKVDRRVLWLTATGIIAVTVAVGYYNPGRIPFRRFTLFEVLQFVSPLMMVALFIERVLEVFLNCLRLQRPRSVGAQSSPQASTAVETEIHSLQWGAVCRSRSQTRRVAFVAGTALGAIVAALGIRVLEAVVDPGVFAALPVLHQRMFRTADVLMTGAVLGGGSDALHQMVLVFTNFFQSAAGRVKGEVGQAKG